MGLENSKNPLFRADYKGTLFFSTFDLIRRIFLISLVQKKIRKIAKNSETEARKAGAPAPVKTQHRELVTPSMCRHLQTPQESSLSGVLSGYPRS